MEKLLQLERETGHTRIVELLQAKLPNNNRVFVKLECENPTGSHYDRVYFRLFHALEASGKIIRGRTRLIETSSGSAGRSVAYFGMILGYNVTLVVPAGLPVARIEAMRKFGATIIEADGPTVSDAVRKLRIVLAEDKRNQPCPDDRYFCMNHSRDLRSLDAVESIADEVKEHLNGLHLDYFVGACGNGTSLIGVGRRLKTLFPSITIVGCEPQEACPITAGFDESRRTKVGAHPFRAHNVFGAGVPQVYFPFFEAPSSGVVLDQAIVIRENERNKALEALNSVEDLDAGRSTALCFAAIRQLSEKTYGKNFLMLLYDSFSKYY